MAALLSRLSLSQYGAALCSELGVTSVADLRHATDKMLQDVLPAMRPLERARLLAEVVAPAAAAPAAVAPAALAPFAAPVPRPLQHLHAAPGATTWDFFLSFYQLNGGLQMGQLAAELQLAGKRVFDVRRELEYPAGYGVANSAVFLLFLTRGVFTRPFVVNEVRAALRLGKPLILLRETDSQRTYVSPEGLTQPVSASAEEHRAAAAKEGLEHLFRSCVVREHQVHGFGLGDERQAMIEMLCDAATPTVVRV